MELVVLSAPEAVKDEIEIVTRFFELGMQKFHLRKPLFSAVQTELLLKQIPEKYHSKIVLHAHHYLADKYKLGGVHFTKKHFQWSTSRMKNFSALIKPGKGKTVSASFHSLSEVTENAENYNYLFLSPVFDSISKQNYRGSFDLTTLKVFLQQYKTKYKNVKRSKVIGLGGMRVENLQLAFDTGFDGAAFFGILWTQNKTADIIKTFQQLKENCMQIEEKGNLK